MIHILVTGAEGFIGKNLVVAFGRLAEVVVHKYDLGYSPADLRAELVLADVIFHLAGVNRPSDVAEFAAGNAGFTVELCAQLRELGRAPKIVFSSSIQAERDNAYGLSKRRAEDALLAFSVATGAECVVFRLKNLFGKWSRPHYNSVVATFCHEIARDRPVTISNPAHEVDLTYIDDVVDAFMAELRSTTAGFRFAPPLASWRVRLGVLAEYIRDLRNQRGTLQLPNFADGFQRALYATYLSYLEPTDLGYSLAVKTDPRGSLAEFIKAPALGQVFVSRTRPGITRGNHFHHTKAEKFLVIEGEAVIRFRSVLGGKVLEYRVGGWDFRVVDIPPGYSHSIQNVGQNDLVTIFWANEIFDPCRSDTYSEEV